MNKTSYYLVTLISLFIYFNQIHSKAIKDDPINDNDDCKKCRAIANDFIDKRRTGATKDEMHKIFKDLCMEYMYGGEEYCDGILKSQLDVGLYILDNRKNLTGARICAIYLQYKMCIDPDLGNWKVNIPEKSNEIQTNNTEQSNNGKQLKLLHISDMHYDVKYKPGSNSKCSKVLCCREDSGDPEKPEDAAGYWGSYDVCDIPWHTVDEILNRINNTHKDIDFIYYTGDIVGHTSYETSISSNTEEITKLYRALKETFGSIPVYPVLGNHEAHPPDFYAPDNVTENLSIQWLFNLTIAEWSAWFSTKELENTLRKGGFYTLLLKPGYRLIALNNNIGYINNLWLIYDDVDPYGELQWLVDTLYEAEKNGERVHLIGHIEPGENLVLKTWTSQYHRIIRRFSNTISAQINGHSHIDEFRLFYNEKNPEEVIGYSFVAGSGTTFVGYNPDYRIYTIDSDTYKVVDYVQYTFNLTEANQHPKRKPNWYKQYSFLDEYNMKEISSKSMHQLVQDLSANDTIAFKYFQNQVRYSDYYLNQGCDSRCLQQRICRINSIEFEDAIKCFEY